MVEGCLRVYAGNGLEVGEGYNSGKSYHVRAIDKGDNEVNRIRTPLTTALLSLAGAFEYCAIGQTS